MNQMRVRIATWNVARPRPHGWKKTPERYKQIFKGINADIWIVTEAQIAVAPELGFGPITSDSTNDLPKNGEHWVAIWSRWPMTRLSTNTPTLAACAQIEVPGPPLTVYGTVFPDGTAKPWQPHYDAIEAQLEDWLEHQAQHPKRGFVLAGDFNQSRSYGTQHGRNLLSNALDISKLTCVTNGRHQLIEKNFHQMIDHICVSAEWLPFVRRSSLRKVEPISNDGVSLSDHQAVYIDLKL